MQKVGGEYYNIAYALGRQTGFVLVGSMGSSVMQYEPVTPPMSEAQQDLGGFGDMGDVLGGLLGVEDNPRAERISVPSFGIEKRVGPVYAGFGFYNTGFLFTQTATLFQSDYTSQFSYLHLYSFYPYVISSRIAVGGGLGIGIPIDGQLSCSGLLCNEGGSQAALETEDIGKEINLLINTSFALTERYAVRVYYQHGLTEIGEYYPLTEDDPSTPIDMTAEQNFEGKYPGDESHYGYKGFSTQLIGVSLLLRF